MKKILVTLLALVMCMSCMSFAVADEVTLEVMSTYADDVLATVREIAEAFMAENPDIKIEITAPGPDYEKVMKTRMGSGDLPDVWETHGWAVRRYGEYLLPLNDQPWVSRMDTGAAAIVTDANGDIKGLDTSLSMGGCIYNKDVLEAAGVDPAKIHSLQDFYDACEAIKAIGKIPVFVGGKDSGNAAGFFAAIASAMFTAKGAKYDLGSTLLDGTFDWDTYGTEMFKEVAYMVEKGYINENFTTADTVAQCTAIGSGDCGFLWRHAQNITWARQYVPECNLGFMPYPSFSGEGMAFMSGEWYCLGINKDTANKEAALKYVDFCSRPENIEKICRITGALPGFTDVTIEGDYAIDVFREAQKVYADVVEYTNLFDRQYFPNGMWGVMGETITSVVMDPTDAGVAAAVENAKTNFTDKFEADGN